MTRSDWPGLDLRPGHPFADWMFGPRVPPRLGKLMETTPDDTNASRHQWEIDRLLARLVGRPMRVAAEWFSPVRWDGRSMSEFVRVADLILPDNS